jgi:hypothetical protein
VSPTDRLLCLAAVLWLAAASHASAQAGAAIADPRSVQPERPTVATHAGTVAPGWAELEAGVQHSRLHEVRALDVPGWLKLGVGPRLQLGIGGVWSYIDAEGRGDARMGDPIVGLKWRMLEGAPLVGDFALQPSITLPIGSRVEPGGERSPVEATLLLISSHRLGPVAMDLNAGVTRRSGDGSLAPRMATSWTASFGAPVTGALGWVVEGFGYPGTSGPEGTVASASLLTGPTYLVRPWLGFDAGVVIALIGDEPDAVYAGLTWNLGRFAGARGR